MIHYYKITFSRVSPRRTQARRERRVVAADLPQAISRALAKAERAHPGALVAVEDAHIYDHTTETWERIALHDTETGG